MTLQEWIDDMREHMMNCRLKLSIEDWQKLTLIRAEIDNLAQKEGLKYP